MSFRTDRHNNPCAFTTALAEQAGLDLNVDYTVGEPFENGRYFTAKLLGNPIDVTIRLIDAVGYYTKTGVTRWVYIALPKFIWDSLSREQKVRVIGWHYKHEGGVEMKGLFPE